MLAKIRQLKMSDKSLEYNLAFFEYNKESLKGSVAARMTMGICLGTLFNNVRARVADS